jgi:hypothetical protein
MPHHTEFSRARGAIFCAQSACGSRHILPRGFPIFSNGSRKTWAQHVKFFVKKNYRGATVHSIFQNKELSRP